MTKCAIYEKGNGKEDIRLSGMYKADYVRVNLLKSIVFVSIGYFFLCLLLFAYSLEDFSDKAFELDYDELKTRLIAIYLVILAVYLVFGWIIHNVRYSRSRARLANYFKTLGRINKMNEENERTKELDEWSGID